MNNQAWLELPDLHLTGILAKDSIRAPCWLSPSIQGTEGWCGRANRTRWMHQLASDDIRDELERVLCGPGVYMWVLPVEGEDENFRILHVGKASVSIEERQKVHLRHACNGKDFLWYPKGGDLKHGALERHGCRGVKPCWSDLESYLPKVRILCISLEATGAEAKQAVSVLEAALVRAAVAHFTARLGLDGWDYVSNSKDPAFAQVSDAQVIAARDAVNVVLPLLV